MVVFVAILAGVIVVTEHGYEVCCRGDEQTRSLWERQNVEMEWIRQSQETSDRKR